MRRTDRAFRSSIGLLLLSFGLALPTLSTQAAQIDGDAVHKVLPSVVSITIWKPAKGGQPAEQFYGSGFIVDPTGFILTNRHVIEGAASITVTFPDGSRSEASLCHASQLIDLALIKVSAAGQLPTVRWGDSEKLHVGDQVLAIGNPLDVGESVSAGVVSALHRRTSSSPFDDFIQTDAAINHGNSGGAMVNAAGEVVGVNTQFLSSMAGGGAVGIGFAIPSVEAKVVVDRMKSCRPSKPGWIGLTAQEVTPPIAHALGLAKAIGSIVTSVAPDSPAERAGIQEGDVIEMRDGKAMPTPLLLVGLIAMTPVGTPITLDYVRHGKTAEAKMTVAAWPGLPADASANSASAAAMKAMSLPGGLLGIHFVNQKGPAGTAQVTVSSIDPASRASGTGLRAGDVVLRINDMPSASVASADAVQSALRDVELQGKDSALLLVEGSGGRRWVVVPLGGVG